MAAVALLVIMRLLRVLVGPAVDFRRRVEREQLQRQPVAVLVLLQLLAGDVGQTRLQLLDRL